MSTTRAAGYTQHGPIDVTTTNPSSLNGLGQPWRRAIVARFDRAPANPQAHAMVRTGDDDRALEGGRCAP